MPVVPEENRIKELQRLGLSESLILLSEGKILDEMFEYRCKTPFYVYHGSRLPEGELIVPLWDCGDVVTALRGPSADELEFIRFGIEHVDEFQVIARTEQGLLAHLFVELLEDNDEWTPREFDESANLVGFRYMSTLVTEYNSSDHSTSERHGEFVRRLVSAIDKQETGG
jgi:hypothetical protein